MQRSSASIGTLASALAKAQGELVNPEKSLVATIRGAGPKGTEQTFRYAPLSSGLDIVRKILGQHEIATVQTTSIDQRAGIINLTTVLAHASGEWIASDWPVCAISETATPHRMGAALTYARRYALFTLVGIAGEDDLDAPDLATPTTSATAAEKLAPQKNARPNGGRGNSPGAKATLRPSLPILGAEASTALRSQLAGELKDIGSAEEAANWAHRVLRAKGSLTAADATWIEDAFQFRLTAFESTAHGEVIPSSSEENVGTTSGIDKSQLAHPEPRRIRDRDHIRFVAKQPCLICGRRPSDAHHLRFAQPRAIGRKVSDEFTVPLCRGHHREVHRSTDEGQWWKSAAIDPTVPARALWLDTHPKSLPRTMISKSETSTLADTDPNKPKQDRVGQTMRPELQNEPN